MDPKSTYFKLSGTKFEPKTLTLNCKQKSSTTKIGINKVELITSDDKNKSTYYDCDMMSFKNDNVLENYTTSFTLSGPNGGPNKGAFNGYGGDNRETTHSLFKNCTKNTKPLPRGNPENITMISQYSQKDPMPVESNCHFFHYI